MTKKESQMRMTDAEIAAMIENKTLAIVPNTHGVLAATKDGQICNVKTGRVLKQSSNGWAGYQKICTTWQGIRIQKTVHRCVWEAWNGVCPLGLEIGHLDDNKENNHLSNLKAMTHQENCSAPDRIRKFKQSIKAGQNMRRRAEKNTMDNDLREKHAAITAGYWERRKAAIAEING